MFHRRPGSHHSTKKPIRPRVVTLSEDKDDDDDGDMDVEPIPAPPANLAPAQAQNQDQPNKNGTKSKGKPPKSVTTLSFNLAEEGDDDGEMFKVKKSSVSRRLMKEKKHKEKKAQNSDPPSKKLEQSNQGGSVTNDDPTFLRLLTGREAEAIDMESSDEDGPPQIAFRNRKKPSSVLAASTLDSLRQSLNTNQIPDANLIHEVRKRRQAMARGQTLPEFIPVETTNPSSATARGSRLHGQYSEDDDSGDPDDNRIELSVSTTKQDSRKKKRADIEIALDEAEAEEEDHDQDSDEGEDLWEQQQLRKVLQDSSGTQVSIELINHNHHQETSHMNSVPTGPKEFVPPEVIVSNLKTTLSNLKAIRDSHKSQLSQISADLELHNQEIREAEMMRGKLNEKFMLYQDLKFYFSDYLGCWGEKLPAILVHRTALLNHYKTRTTNLTLRHRQDVQDELNQVNNQVIDDKTSRRVAEREGRRGRRKREREKIRDSAKEGWSTDDEEPEMDRLKWKIMKDSIIHNASEGLADVKLEFYSIPTLLSKFTRWKTVDPWSYSESYANLCLVKLLGPLLQWKLLESDPVGEDFNFNKTDWVRYLIDYSTSGLKSVDELQKNSDIRLLPSVMEKLLVPWIESSVGASYSPLSTSQSLRLSSILQKLIFEWSVDPKSKSMNQLLLGLINKFKDAVENDVFIPLFGSNKGPGALFFTRQFNSALKLLRNMCSFSLILSPKPLQTLALDALLTRYILMGLRTGSNLSETLERAKGIVQVLPREWISPGGSSDNQHQDIPNGITQLVRSIVGIVKQQGQNDSSKSAILELCSLLKQIGGEVEGDIILSQFI